jgi:hypothetical protein
MSCSPERSFGVVGRNFGVLSVPEFADCLVMMLIFMVSELTVSVRLGLACRYIVTLSRSWKGASVARRG